MAQRAELLPIFLQRKKHCGLRAVVIPNVVVYFLEVPHRTAGKQVYGHNRCRKQIVATPILAKDVGRGIPYAEIHKSEVRIDRRRDPDRSATGQERLASEAGRLRRREVPNRIAGLSIQRKNLASYLILATG